MLSISRIRTLLGLALVAGVLTSTPVGLGQGAKKGNTKSVTFKTYDGVELSGTFYPNSSGKRDATVLLLHDLDPKGTSSQEGWGNLATALQADGYAVLIFDFRGFGDSKNVNKDLFWKFQQSNLIKGSLKKPEQIDFRNFPPNYLPYLVNDIAAAKAFLDRQNDQKACNTSSLVVIGAGQGATLGTLWMANECRRRKDKNQPNPLVLQPPVLGEPECRDVAAGIWLTLSPTLGKRKMPVSSWLAESCRDNKIPMAFVFGKGDATGDNFSKAMLSAVRASGTKVKDKQLTGAQAISDTKLTGAGLLDDQLETRGWILKDYLGKVMEARGNKEWNERKVESSAYWYTQPKSSKPFRINKKPGEEVPQVELRNFLQGG